MSVAAAGLARRRGLRGEGFGDVLGRVAPCGAPQEQGVAVLPLAALPVEGPRGGRDGEVGDRDRSQRS
jgi:hypothetical protein